MGTGPPPFRPVLPQVLCWRLGISELGCLSSGSRPTWNIPWNSTESARRQGTRPWPAALWSARTVGAALSCWSSRGLVPTSTHTAAREDRLVSRAPRAPLAPHSTHLHQRAGSPASHGRPGFPRATAPSARRLLGLALRLSVSIPHLPRRAPTSPRERGPRPPPTPTATHILAFARDFTWVLALLPGEVGGRASQVCQGVLHNVSGVGRAGDSDVVLKRPVIWVQTERKEEEEGEVKGQGQKGASIGQKGAR